MKLKKELYKWQFGAVLTRNAPWRINFSPYIVIWALKFISLPDPGAAFTRANYRGFFWEWSFNKVFIVTSRTVVVPNWLRLPLWRIGIRTCQVYQIPYKIWVA